MEAPAMRVNVEHESLAETLLRRGKAPPPLPTPRTNPDEQATLHRFDERSGINNRERAEVRFHLPHPPAPRNDERVQ